MVYKPKTLPLDYREAFKSWMIATGQGRATRKNKKNYGRPSVPEKKRAPSQNELRKYLPYNPEKY
tara:strand:+ start:75 stop:269 length:195 start_codon:yes stop_codon:yes gene_type:complete